MGFKSYVILTAKVSCQAQGFTFIFYYAIDYIQTREAIDLIYFLIQIF